MEFKVCVVFAVILFVGLARNTVSYPKDSTVTVVKSESLPDNQDSVNTERKFEQQVISKGNHIPGRAWCQHDGSEPTEDDVCLEHCIPKGYSYGLCISNTCSCI